jgi:LacI family transcriptional regulator
MHTKKRITIVEIAKACGVSKTTVGYALDEKTAAKVSPQKIELINSTVKRLGYVPNHSARTLRTQKTYIIGIMLPEPENNFYGRMALFLQKELAKRGYTALFSFWNDLDDAVNIDKTLKMFISRGVDGIITCELPGVHFENCPVPVIFWQTPPSGFDSVSNFPCIKSAYREIVGILKAKGCREFAIIAPFLSNGRPVLILDVLAKEGIYPKPEYLFDKVVSYETAQKAMREILQLKTRPDVVFGNNDIVTMGAMSEALNAGVKIPKEMKFVGFDGIDESKYFYPSLTTFYVSVEEATKKLLKLLFMRIENRNAKIVNLSVVPKLMVRNSI